MANDLNLCQFIGRLGQDPEIKYLSSGDAVANLSIAVGDAWKDKQTGHKQERTTWVNIVAFKRLAEIIGEYCHKGSQVYISGELRVRKWQDQSGNDRWTTEIVAKDLQMLGGRGDSNNQLPQQSPRPQQAPAPQQQAQPAPRTRPSGHPAGVNHPDQTQQAPPPAQGFDDFDDDIPF